MITKLGNIPKRYDSVSFDLINKRIEKKLAQTDSDRLVKDTSSIEFETIINMPEREFRFYERSSDNVASVVIKRNGKLYKLLTEQVVSGVTPTPGAGTWVGLSDTPSSFTAGSLSRVNSGASALEFVVPGTSGNVVYDDGSIWGSATPDIAGLVDKASAQSITGLKTFSTNVLDLDGVSIQAEEISTPSTPSTNHHKIYPKSDDKWYTINDAGVESVIGVTDHGNLTGLTDDDHMQYALLAGRAGGQVLIGGTGTTDDLTLQTTSGVGASGADMHFLVGNNGATEALTVLNSGFVGVNDTAPTVELDITGTLQVKNSSDPVPEINNTGDTTSTRTASLLLSHEGTENVQFIARRESGDSDGGSLRIQTRPVAGSLTNAIVVDSSQRVGLGGITTITNTLHVSGTFRLTSGFFDSNNDDGASGDVLTSTGSATDWVPASQAVGGGFTAGSVIFADGTQLQEDNSNFFWDDAANELGIGTNTPDATLDILDTSGPQLRLTNVDNTTFCDFTLDSGDDLTITPSSTGKIILQPTTDSVDFFQVLDANGGTPIINIDSTNERVGISTATPSHLFHVTTLGSVSDKLFVVEGTTSSAEGCSFSPIVSNSSNLQRGFIIKPKITGSGDGPAGLGAQPTIEPSANINSCFGTINLAALSGSSDVTFMYANLYRPDTLVAYTGAVTNIFGLMMSAPVYSGSKPVVSRGIQVQNYGVSGVASAAGILIQAQSGATNNWNLYSDGATSRNYFAGDIGIGVVVPQIKLDLVDEDAVTSAITNVVRIGHNSTGTPAAGFGSSVLFRLESSTTADQSVGAISYEWATATHASRKALSRWTVYDTAERTGIEIEADGSDAVTRVVGGLKKSATRLTSTTTLDGSHYCVFCDTDGGGFTVNLPAGIAEVEYRIINTGSSANNLTVSPNGAELLVGVNANVTLADGEALVIQYETTEGWW